jgi:hypothetical protein
MPQPGQKRCAHEILKFPRRLTPPAEGMKGKVATAPKSAKASIGPNVVIDENAEIMGQLSPAAAGLVKYEVGKPPVRC